MSHTHSLLLAALVAGLSPALVSCNAITGASDLRVVKEEEKDPMVGATGITVREVALYQGVKRPLMENGGPSTSTLPIIPGRDAMIRVFYDADETFPGGQLTGRLHIEGQSDPIEVVVETVAGVSSSADAELPTTVNFDVPGEMMVPGMAYRVELLQDRKVSPEDNAAAKYPAEGTEALAVDASQATLQIKLIPVAYGADGSNRMPDTSEQQVKGFRDLFYAMYPLSGVEITVGEKLNWSQVISPNGAGWEELLDGVATRRTQDNPPDNVYYYGIFTPAPSFDEFCSGGCVAGLGFVTTPSDVYGRAAIGIGYTGNDAFETAAHEVGHNHGRDHAPCQTAGEDPSFPYANGSIGVWGYNLVTRQLFDPAQTADVMGYCTPLWVSDYTFRALYGRVQQIDGVRMVFPPESLDLTYDRVRVDGTGNATFLAPLTLHKPPMAEPAEVELTTDAGVERVTGQLYRYDHIDGGVLFWPRSQAGLRSASFRLDGQQIRATR